MLQETLLLMIWRAWGYAAGSGTLKRQGSCQSQFELQMLKEKISKLDAMLEILRSGQK